MSQIEFKIGETEVGLIATLTFVVWGGMGAVLATMGHGAVASVCVVLGVVFVAVAVLLNGERGSNWLNALIARDGPPSLYDGVLDRAMPWLRDKLHIAEPAPDALLVDLLRSAFTYRLLDRALLIAVIYPLLLLVMHWGVSGQTSELGTVEIIAVADPYWRGPAILCGMVVVAGAFHYQERITAVSQSSLLRFSCWTCFFQFCFLQFFLNSLVSS